MSKKVGLSEEEFYKALSERNNYIDPETVKIFYRELVKLIVAELRNKGRIRLPDFGDLRITKYRTHRIIDVNTRKEKVLPEMIALKFDACPPLKEYIRNFKREG